MKTWQKMGLGVLVLIIAACIYFYPKYQMLQHSIHLFDEDKIVENFRSFNEIWAVRELKAPEKSIPYARKSVISLPDSFTFQNEDYNTEQFLKDGWTTGFLVIQNDSIVFEDYYLGNHEYTRNISWSMAKSYISALFGIAIQEGHIKA